LSRFRTRLAAEGDLPFLWEMLGEALAWPDRPASLAEMRADPHMSCYLDGWGRKGDAGVVAEDEREQPLGAAWYRLFPERLHGHGFVSEEVPELAIAVRERARDHGVGTALLTALIDEARRQGMPALSLSSDREGRPRRLYEHLGFRVCGQVPAEDLVIMRLDLA
jgi:GNAT superfamily N-acetyltransferase